VVVVNVDFLFEISLPAISVAGIPSAFLLYVDVVWQRSSD
jgi:hypothetical protein